MYYKYNKKTMQYSKLNWTSISIKTLGIIILISLLINLSFKTTAKNEYTEAEVKIIVDRENTFSEEKLVNLIKHLNFKFPHIVYAQAVLESNNFKSNMFIENNNMFGMKEAMVRISTAKGTQNGHAFYDDWKDCLYDYALYSARYLGSITSEEDYLNYISQNYAEDGEYINKLKKVIVDNRIINKFK